MNINPLAILFGIIALPEPAVDPEDTQEFRPMVLHTRRIDKTELHELTQLDNTLAAYRLGGYGEWILGHITAAAETKTGRIMVHFQPVPRADMALLDMWRDMNDVVYAWYEKAGE